MRVSEHFPIPSHFLIWWRTWGGGLGRMGVRGGLGVGVGAWEHTWADGGEEAHQQAQWGSSPSWQQSRVRRQQDGLCHSLLHYLLPRHSSLLQSQKGMATPAPHTFPHCPALLRVWYRPCQRVPRVSVSTDSTQEEHVQNATTSCVRHCCHLMTLTMSIHWKKNTEKTNQSQDILKSG